MTKRLIALLALCVPLVLLAEVKIGTVNIDAVFASHPRRAAAQQELRDLSGKLHGEYQAMQADYNKKYAAYQQISGDAATPEPIKERRVQELQEGDIAIGDFFEKTQRTLDERKRELEAPIYAEIDEAVKQVGEREGFTYILDVSKTPVAYAGKDAIDITESVKAIIAEKN